uniref:Uncharacterized protein n=1 Tax=Setaria viridis TaxID=4556 RepID=A0A4U6W5H2_SETVI|nr:hypothetical protein SEVIR_2G408232v2 [Setaria viridis]
MSSQASCGRSLESQDRRSYAPKVKQKQQNVMLDDGPWGCRRSRTTRNNDLLPLAASTDPGPSGRGSGHRFQPRVFGCTAPRARNPRLLFSLSAHFLYHAP